MKNLKKRLFSILMIIGILLTCQYEGLSSEYKPYGPYDEKEYFPSEAEKRRVLAKRKREEENKINKGEPNKKKAKTSNSNDNYTATNNNNTNNNNNLNNNQHSANDNVSTVNIFLDAKSKTDRATYNDDIIDQHINDPDIKTSLDKYKGHKSEENLLNFLTTIATIADEAYGNIDDYGTLITAQNLGTFKHTLCEKFLERIKKDPTYKDLLENINTEVKYHANDDGKGIRIDVQKAGEKVHTFDYKFGKAGVTTKQIRRYVEVLKQNGITIKTVHEVRSDNFDKKAA